MQQNLQTGFLSTEKCTVPILEFKLRIEEQQVHKITNENSSPSELTNQTFFDNIRKNTGIS